MSCVYLVMSYVSYTGDQCQLPPSVMSDALRDSGLVRSLFERMLAPAAQHASQHGAAVTTSTPYTRARDHNAAPPLISSLPLDDPSSPHRSMVNYMQHDAASHMGITPALLRVQYRMHPLISHWPNHA